MFLIICVERLATSHWQLLFSKKMAAAASFSYKIGGGGLIFLKNWRWRQVFGNITAGCSDMVWILERNTGAWGPQGLDFLTMLAPGAGPAK